MKKNGQISMEYLMIIGFALLMIIPIIIIFFYQTETITTSVSLSQARTVARTLVDNAESVYYLGKPAMTTITVIMPKNVENLTIIEKELVLTLNNENTVSDIFEIAEVNMTGNFSISEGPHKITIRAETGYVSLFEE